MSKIKSIKGSKQNQEENKKEKKIKEGFLKKKSLYLWIRKRKNIEVGASRNETNMFFVRES